MEIDSARNMKKAQHLSVTFISNMFPQEQARNWGVFISEQIASLQAAGIDSSIVFRRRSHGRFFSYISLAWQLVLSSKRRKVDILHVHFGLTFFLLLPIIVFARSCNRAKAVIVTLHGTDILGPKKWLTFVVRHSLIFADGVIAVSDEILNRLPSPVQRISIRIPCGVSRLFTPRRQTPERLVVFPSSVSRPEKNFSAFLRIISRVREADPDLDFSWCELSGLTREQVWELFSKATCLLLTSSYEGSPQVVKEAVATGLPVLSFDVGDVSEIVRSEEACFVSDSEETLSLKLVNLLRNPVHYEPTLQFINRYSLEAVAKEIRRFYRTVLE